MHGHFWVPIDDHSCWAWSYDYHPTRPLTDGEVAAMKDGKGIHVKYVPGTYRPLANKDNDYLMNREAQKAGRTFSGIEGIGMQDAMAKILAAIARSPLNIAAIFFAIVVAAPVVEELLFRGMLQKALAKYLPIWGAILLSSFLFALVHGQPYAIPGLMSLSLAFGYLYHRTGSLRTNIILHMANNAFALLALQTLN